MAINFNQNSTFNLKPINKESVRGEVMGLFGEWRGNRLCIPDGKRSADIHQQENYRSRCSGNHGKAKVFYDSAIFQNPVFFNSDTGIYGSIP